MYMVILNMYIIIGLQWVWVFLHTKCYLHCTANLLMAVKLDAVVEKCAGHLFNHTTILRITIYCYFFPLYYIVYFNCIFFFRPFFSCVCVYVCCVFVWQNERENRFNLQKHCLAALLCLLYLHLFFYSIKIEAKRQAPISIYLPFVCMLKLKLEEKES